MTSSFRLFAHAFEYTPTPSVIPISPPTANQVYEQATKASSLNFRTSLLLAFCIVLGVYLACLGIAWWIDYSNMIGTIPLFKIVTFGIGNIEKIKPKPFFLICTSIYFSILLIVTGMLQRFTIFIFTSVLKLPTYITSIFS